MKQRRQQIKTLKFFFLSTCLLSGLLPGFAFGQTNASPFSTYIHQYTSPEYIQTNTIALDARLKLLDVAPSGSKAKIATFVFDNGRATRSLARHVCLAQQRGVQVELLVDSKSGDQPGLPSPFDGTDDSYVQEELYQYMANCGATIYVHNHLESYIDALGTKMPNIFLDPKYDHTKFSFLNFNLLALQNRLNAIVSKAAAIIQPSVNKVGANGDVKPLLTNLKTLAMNFLQLMSAAKDAEKAPVASGDDTNSSEEAFNQATDALRASYLAILNDPLLNHTSAAQMRAALPAIADAIKADPEFAKMRMEIRRFNRLNHRKLFMVESPSGKEACMILGGRNLGDRYLQDTTLTYLDGDILTCRHHSADASSAIDAAAASFENLKSDLADPVLGLASDNKVRKIQPNANYVYRHLVFPEGLLPAGAKVGQYAGSLATIKRVLIKEVPWKDKQAVHGELAIKDSSNWRLLTTGWEPKKDQVAKALVDMINREQKEIYIETAYGDFNSPLKQALEEAMKRGVKVNLITNSFFISDGGSKVIRILMANWAEKTKANFHDLFDIQYTSAAAGHMTHFKGAGFACMKADGGAIHRGYLLGSHNFHGRSGHDDKEHALMWTESSGNGCASGFNGLNDMVNMRRKLFADMTKKVGTKVLVHYSNLIEELDDVSYNNGVNMDENKTQSLMIARALRRVFYDESSSGKTLHDAARVHQLLDLIDEGGFHDLFGLVL